MTKSLHFEVTVVIFLVCGRVFCADAQQCKSVHSTYGMMLRGFVFQESNTANMIICGQLCNANIRCQSINYVISRNLCELNSRTKEARPDNYVPDTDRIYVTRPSERAPLGSIQELPAESCSEIKASEGGSVVSGKYWLDSIKPGQAVSVPCDMLTGDADECNASVPVCDVNAICQNTLASFKCTCKTGFTGNGLSCRDADECKASALVCDVNAVCQNTFESFQCTGKTGFTGNGLSCRDIDECTRGSHNCMNGPALCLNTLGSYQCACKPGYRGDGQRYCILDECKNYQVLSDANRKVTNGGTPRLCDSSLGPAWFRFQGDAGTKMVTRCVSLHRCGTDVPGWFNGAHPQAHEGNVTRQVCFRYAGNCCYWSVNIQVQNCSGYYLYYIHGTPVSCYLRYCSTD
ncbi:uromodulin-like [Montipora capricornis]|uniref:uromodulin-like n=1 Tax=Montipora capricornis TaxID=246305 RepID=UPI0035F1BEDA